MITRKDVIDECYTLGGDPLPDDDQITTLVRTLMTDKELLSAFTLHRMIHRDGPDSFLLAFLNGVRAGYRVRDKEAKDDK